MDLDTPGAGERYERLDCALGAYERCCVTVSLPVNCSQAPWPHAALHRFTKPTLGTCGPQRCLWGSNHPLCPDTVSSAQILAVVQPELPFRTGADLAAVLGGTAQSLWQPR